jgi:hypothetical protein
VLRDFPEKKHASDRIATKGKAGEVSRTGPYFPTA